MTGLLIKKQIKELTSFFTQNKKTGKKRNKGGKAGYIVLYAFIYLMLAFSFGAMALLFAQFIELGLNWVYFALMGVIALLMTTILSMFIASSTLFNANDNELLLSMPIKPSDILISRMAGLYFWILIYESMVSLPTIIMYLVYAGITVANIIFPIIGFIVISILSLALSCIFGWVVALIKSKIKSKIVTTIIAFVFIGLFYYFGSIKMSSNLDYIVTNVDSTMDFFNGYGSLFGLIGQGCAGNVIDLLLFIAISVGLTTLTCAVISFNFIKIITKNTGEKKVAYNKKEIKETNASQALVKKELKHFVSSFALLMNVGIGLILMPVVAIIFVSQAGDIRPLLDLAKEVIPEYYGFLPSIIILFGLFVIPMTCLTNTSISLEGKNLWILKTLPINTYDFLSSKIRTQMILVSIPLVMFSVVTGVCFKLSVSDIFFTTVVLLAYELLVAYLGLYLNIKKPNFDWTNETYVVKQSSPVAICLFGGWGVSILYGVVCFFLRDLVNPFSINIIFFALSMMFVRLLDKWLRTEAVRLVEEM